MHTMVLDEGGWDNIPDPSNIGRHCDRLMLKESPRNTAYFLYENSQKRNFVETLVARKQISLKIYEKSKLKATVHN